MADDKGGGVCYQRGQVRYTVMDYSFIIINWIDQRGRSAGSNTPSLINRDIYYDRTLSHRCYHLLGYHERCFPSRDIDGTNKDVGRFYPFREPVNTGKPSSNPFTQLLFYQSQLCYISVQNQDIGS